MKSETVIFQGIKYTRYPESKKWDRRNYFQSSTDIGRRGYRQTLHTAVWEFTHGPRPLGFVVHHIDHNPLNNEPSNLALMPKAEHMQMHRHDVDYGAGTCERCGVQFIKKYKVKQRFCSGVCRNRAAASRNMRAHRTRSRNSPA